MFIKTLPVGVDNFEKLVTRDYYFVDKTNFIKDLLEIGGDVNVFTRPRCFGKTLNLSMLQYFFEDMRDNDGRKIDNTGLFDGLDILQAGERYLTLQIPNYEVDHIFREKIMSWFQEKIQADDLTRLYTAFVYKDAEVVQEELNRILLETISSLDEQESYYHGLVAGLLSPMKGYRTKSNREAGMGRCDLFIKPVSRRKEAFVIEFKVAKRLRDLEARADEALRQIEDRKYVSELEDEDYDRVSCYVIAFCGKECLVKVNVRR